jgi:hypothetical protein
MANGRSGATRRIRRGALLGVGIVGLLAACQPMEGDGDDNGDASVAEEAVLGANGLTINGLTINGLAPTSLAALRDKTPAGAVTRLFFRYLISCALPAGHDVSYSWTDAAAVRHAEVASGQFGLASTWESGAVDLAGQELVSACLFARTNALGISVPISMRGEGASTLAVTAQERADFHYGEGAFWGNVFADPPYGRSCSRSPFDAGTRTSADLKNGRVCASRDCGIIRYVGPCYASSSATSGQACFRRAANNDWVSDCNASMSFGRGSSSHVISTWLRP